MSRRSTCRTRSPPSTIVVESPVPTGQNTTPRSGSSVSTMRPASSLDTDQLAGKSHKFSLSSHLPCATDNTASPGTSRINTTNVRGRCPRLDTTPHTSGAGRGPCPQPRRLLRRGAGRPQQRAEGVVRRRTIAMMRPNAPAGSFSRRPASAGSAPDSRSGACQMRSHLASVRLLLRRRGRLGDVGVGAPVGASTCRSAAVSGPGLGRLGLTDLLAPTSRPPRPEHRAASLGPPSPCVVAR